MVKSGQWKENYVKEMLGKYLDLEKSCLSESEKKTSKGYVI